MRMQERIIDNRQVRQHTDEYTAHCVLTREKVAVTGDYNRHSVCNRKTLITNVNTTVLGKKRGHVG